MPEKFRVGNYWMWLERAEDNPKSVDLMTQIEGENVELYSIQFRLDGISIIENGHFRLKNLTPELTYQGTDS